MSTYAVHQALSIQLATLGLPIASENVKYTPTEGTLYLRETFAPDRAEAASLGVEGFNRLPGVYLVDVFAPAGAGWQAAEQAAEAVLAGFPRGKVLSLGGAIGTHLAIDIAASASAAEIIYADNFYLDSNIGSPKYTNGDCSLPTPVPHLVGDGPGALLNCSLAQTAGGGNPNFRMTKTAGGALSRWTLVDSALSNDLHGFIPGRTYQHQVQIFVPGAGGPLLSEVEIRVYVNNGAGLFATVRNPTAYNTWEMIAQDMVLDRPTMVQVERSYRSKGLAEPGLYHVPVAVEFRADEPPYAVS